MGHFPPAPFGLFRVLFVVGGCWVGWATGASVGLAKSTLLVSLWVESASITLQSALIRLTSHRPRHDPAAHRRPAHT